MKADYYIVYDAPKKSFFKRYPWIINILLFLLSVVTTIIAGTQWAYKDPFDISNWTYGITYSILILTFLSAHEFGHYFAAIYHKVKATLPYYIPFFLPFIMIHFGTMGAVIKTKSTIPSNKALFDIGVAGPISGFIVCLGFLIYGLLSLPPVDFLYSIHPEYLLANNGQMLESGLHFGDTIFYTFLAKLFANPEGFLPPMNEIYHYPFLCVGWFGLFVTSLNMLPIGQLDGGHIVYGMFGSRMQIKIAKIVWWVIFALGISSLLGIIHDLLEPTYTEFYMEVLRNIFYAPLHFIKEQVPIVYDGWPGWLLWSLITRVFIKIKHPVINDDSELSKGRKILGWVSLLILVLCFSWNGIYIIE